MRVQNAEVSTLKIDGKYSWYFICLNTGEEEKMLENRQWKDTDKEKQNLEDRMNNKYSKY